MYVEFFFFRPFLCQLMWIISVNLVVAAAALSCSYTNDRHSRPLYIYFFNVPHLLRNGATLFRSSPRSRGIACHYHYLLYWPRSIAAWIRTLYLLHAIWKVVCFRVSNSSHTKKSVQLIFLDIIYNLSPSEDMMVKYVPLKCVIISYVIMYYVY